MLEFLFMWMLWRLLFVYKGVRKGDWGWKPPFSLICYKNYYLRKD